MKYGKSPLQVKKEKHIKFLNKKPNKPVFNDKYPFSKSQLASLESSFTGKIVFPWTKGYKDDRKIFDNIYQAYPLFIAYAVCFSDIRIVLQLAREFNITTAIRSGGHSFAGYSVCNGIVIDVSGMKNIYVNAAEKFAVIESGCTFENIFPVLEQYGLHMPGGGCPTVAVAGFMQGGGYGITSRAFGMNCDCVLECTVMLADGKLVVANKDQNTDLFWALKGGTGGNFGVLISIKYQLFELGDIWGLKVKWTIDKDPENAALALLTIQDTYLEQGAYPQLGIETVLTTDTDGLMKVFFCATWIGSEDAFDEALTPLQNLPGAMFGPKKSGKYSDINNYVLEGTPDVPDDIKAYSRSAIIERSLSQIEWKTILTFFLTAPNKYTMVDMECYGGQINALKPGDNAFIHRRAKLDFFSLAFFNKETHDQHESELWLEALYEFMTPYTNGHSYQNYPNRRQKDFRWAYWGRYYNQLVLIKQKYDPSNFFRYQQSIGPGVIDEYGNDQIILFAQNEIVHEPY